MEGVLIFLAGFVIGGLIVRRLMIAAHRRLAHPHELDPRYQGAIQVVMAHMRTRGTINATQAAQLLSITPVTADRYLQQMERERFVKLQEHGSASAFYTLP